MGNRGRRRGAFARAHVRDPTAAYTVEKPAPQKQKPLQDDAFDEEDSDNSRRSDAAPSAEIVSLRHKKARGGHAAAVVRYADGASYEGAVDDEQRRHGAGVLVVRRGHTFQGEWVRGVLHGFGSQVFACSGDRYEGMYHKNQRHGVGTYVWSNGDKYVGSWRLGKMHGRGSFSWRNGDSYEGDWKKGMMHGRGKKTLASGDAIDGEWRRNQANGHGVKTFSSGDRYDGRFRRDERQGFGEYTWANGDIHRGAWRAGEMHGEGLFLIAGGGSLQGMWLHGKLQGRGVQRFACGAVYCGDFCDGERHGEGVMELATGEVYEGGWRRDEVDGFGSWSSPVDGQSFAGEWVKGRPSGVGLFSRPRAIEAAGDGDDRSSDEMAAGILVGEFRDGVLQPCGSFVVLKMEIPTQ